MLSLQVVDDEGKKRFHGAFTGGFQAGYNNTVGSKEGFTPTGFVSSRANRAQRCALFVLRVFFFFFVCSSSYCVVILCRKDVRPEDFMDNEDLQQNAIAGDTLKAKEDFQAVESKPKESKKASTSSDFDALIVPAKEPIGMCRSVFVVVRFVHSTIGVAFLFCLCV
jgi:G patch domain-containing protein 1